jgi:glycosyl transferase family 87
VITAACWLISVAGMVAVAVLGPSAAVPPVPGNTRWPPYSLSGGVPDGVVYAIAAVATVAGAVATWRLLRTAGREGGVGPRRLQAAGFLVAGVLTVLPPSGADVMNYIAYGQEAVSGVNPYILGPQSPGVPQDAITQAVGSPWQTTPSVYGPAFTSISTGIAHVARGDGHLAVTLTRVLVAGAFVLTGVVLQALCRTPSARRRAAVMWSANPLMLAALVAGAHLDALVTAAVVCSIALLRRFPLLAGVVLGLAATLKLTALVASPGLVWAVHRRVRSSVLVVLGACAFAVPWLGATPGVFTQLRQASHFTTPAAPWRVGAALVQPAFGYTSARTLVYAVAGLVGLALIALLLRRGLPPAADTTVGRAAATAGAFAIGWLLTTPYILPWYDAVAWALLALAGASFLDRVLLVHTAALTLAFLPGRDVPLSSATELVNRVVHAGLSPVTLAVLIGVTVYLATGGRSDPAHALARTP